ncbi:MAG: DUF2332 domain-containing protein [Gammaproteobacteria bacterium]
MQPQQAFWSASESFRLAGASFARNFGSPFLENFYATVAADPALVELASHARPGQHVHFLFHAVLHYLLLRQPDAALAAFYPSIAPHPAPADAMGPALRTFCLENADAIRTELAQRTIQTTVVNRAAYYLLAVAHASAAAAGAPLALVELGPSAGLNLLFDRYRYDFGTGSAFGDAGAPLTVTPNFRGAVPTPPAEMPRLSARIGIDLNVIDLAREADRLWLLAVLPPDWSDERCMVQAAMDYRVAQPLDIRQGDAVALLPRVSAELDGDLCILHSACINYWPIPAREQFELWLRDTSRIRTVHRLSMEQPSPIPAQDRAKVERGEVLPYEIAHSVYRAGSLERRDLLGRCDSFARWIEWYG